MRPGQPVTIKVDAFPGIKWRGHVDSIHAGSGSRFSVLPAENATGNFVKIVRRVPVKIVFDHDATAQNKLSLEFARQRYAHGLVSFLEALDAERNVLSSQDALAQSNLAVTTDLVALYKALGGGWNK
jgi:hypothetical protein